MRKNRSVQTSQPLNQYRELRWNVLQSSSDCGKFRSLAFKFALLNVILSQNTPQTNIVGVTIFILPFPDLRQTPFLKIQNRNETQTRQDFFQRSDYWYVLLWQGFLDLQQFLVGVKLKVPSLAVVRLTHSQSTAGSSVQLTAMNQVQFSLFK